MPAFPLIPLATAALGGAVLTDQIGKQFKKAGQRKEIDKIVQDALKDRLGDPTGGFGYQTGYGPGMLLPGSAYQAQLAYMNQLGNVNRETMIKNLLGIEPIMDRAKARDFERNMAAARFRTQLGTQQGLTLQGQMGAQALAQQGMQGAVQALGSNYQYQ
tara:strand:+ start:526 stop:1002 length:477 start_codon:yes stop_codon:yes gene_type:complete